MQTYIDMSTLFPRDDVPSLCRAGEGVIA